MIYYLYNYLLCICTFAWQTVRLAGRLHQQQHVCGRLQVVQLHWYITFSSCPSTICFPAFMWNRTIFYICFSTLIFFVGLLDVYGFECFLLNNLEQLCINYANEKLQQHFVAHYLKAQQEEYVSEGLQWSFVCYQDNQRCLDLIEGNPTSIFSLLNEV